MISTVVFRRYLNEPWLDDLYRLAKEHGVHEVRIHQPIPRGELTKPENAEGIIWTGEDTARWLDMQEAANQADHGLKVSSFPYTEGPRKFGCNAALLHLYISATGDVWPCDFIPINFGNVLREDVGDIYRRMQAEAGMYRRRCWAKPLAKKLAARELPLRQDDSADFCRACRAQSGYGDFFKGLQECLNTQDSSKPDQGQPPADELDRRPDDAARRPSEPAAR
jgi:MoaA/NifB/PqqE/SkfB family radical SAM enzyme